MYDAYYYILWCSAWLAVGAVPTQLQDIHRMPRKSCSINDVKLMDE